MNKNGEVKQIEGEYEVTNCTTDGQGLMDESIYEKYQKRLKLNNSFKML